MSMSNTSKEEDPAVKNFRDYLRLKCMHPNPDYDGTVQFLKQMADELQLPCQVVEVAPKNPVVLMTWEGTDPSLPAILLNSHTDVVPVFPEHWKYDPFDAHKDEDGNIYARGSQDMKCVGIQYIEAIRRLRADGKSFPRTIHLSFVPDEEFGGHKGMQILINMPEFKALNVAFALDEGLASPSDAFTLFYGERSPWWVQISCPGKPGHGSRFIENTAAEKLRRIVNTFLQFREEQEDRLKKNLKLRLGDVTTVNMTIVGGGIQTNVVPAEFTADFDIRITPTMDRVEFEDQLKQWCREAGEGVTYTFKQKFMGTCLTPLDKDNVWWHAFSKSCDDIGIVLEPEIFPAATDSRYMRTAGIPALGFSPMNSTPILLHDHNEFLNEDVFLRGIDIYCHILPALASVPSV